MRSTLHAITNWVVGLILLSMSYGVPVFAQGGEGQERPVITRQTAAQLALIGTLERGWIQALAWSSDGAYLAVAASNGTYIYDTTNWEAPPQTLPSYGNAPMNVAWRSGAHELITVHSQGALFHWGLVDGVFERVPDFNIDESNVLLTVNRDRREGYDPLAFTADGSIYVALDIHEGWEDFKYPCEYEICIHEVVSKVNFPVSRTNERNAVLPDGTVLALDREVAISASGLITAEIPQPDPYATPIPPPTSHVVILDDAGNEIGRIASGFTIPRGASGNTPDRIALSPDGSLLAAGGCTWTDETHSFCEQNAIKLFDVTSGQVVLEPKERFVFSIEAIAFSPDGSKLAAADGRIVQVWDVVNGESQAHLIGYGSGAGQLVAHPSLPVLFSGGAGINIWDIGSLSTGDPIASLPSSAPIALSPDGKWLVAGNAGNYFLGEITHPALWNVSNPAAPYAVTELTDLTRTQQVDDVKFSPDGAYLAVTTENAIETGLAVHRHRELRIFETDTFSLVASTSDNFPVQPDFSPDGRWFTYGTMYPTTLWVYSTARLADGDALFSEEPYLKFAESGFVFPPHSKYALLFVDPTKEVQIWDMDARQQVGVEEKRPFWGGTYTTDGSLIVIGDTLYDTTEYETLWDAGTGGGGAAFSADEQYLFLGSFPIGNALYVNHDDVIQVYAVPHSPEEKYTPLLSPYPVHCGGHAEIHVLEGDTLNVRATAGLDGEILAKLESRTTVAIDDKYYCFEYDGQYFWLHIHTAEGVDGWAVMFADGIQTLVLVD